ncbi:MULTISPECIES: toprim domain-containing protein [unclassified Novosphingobium]|uniref:DUF7146 domain-containing protein n=1 Tax=unclassified Novosphingobium TaxID=2644732 RepID=UPI00146EE43A|nr:MULTISPECIES: toprim domain-containing protein [unclassified Novosphingobium]NMN07561.1 hypothetical protein [Novosphingobium sp. SG919]NMN89836.1 hypothetical protein [Novosphingobium sp. SG916]
MALSPIQAAKDITLHLKGEWNDRRHTGLACCPAHPDRNPSLSIRPGHKAVLYHCFAGCSLEQILAALKNLRLSPRIDQNAPPAALPRPDEGNLARQLWSSALPVRGTLAAHYLSHRGLSDLSIGRFLPNAVTYLNERRLVLPAIIFAYENARQVTAIQRVFLDPVTGGKTAILPKAKRNLALPGDGAIRFGRVAGGILNLAEGPEDAASVMLWKNQPGCWAAGGVERYFHIAIPDEVHTVRLWTQHGVAAAQCLEKARPHLTANGRKLIVETPPPNCDWNDAWLSARPRAAGASL